MTLFGKIIVVLGVLSVVAGLVFIVLNNVIPLGKLPGDITYEEGNSKFYFPFGTSIVVSVVLSGLALVIILLFF